MGQVLVVDTGCFQHHMDILWRFPCLLEQPFHQILEMRTMVGEYPGFYLLGGALAQPQRIQLLLAYINADKCHLSIPRLVYTASSRQGRARIPFRLREWVGA